MAENRDKKKLVETTLKLKEKSAELQVRALSRHLLFCGVLRMTLPRTGSSPARSSVTAVQRGIHIESKRLAKLNDQLQQAAKVSKGQHPPPPARGASVTANQLLCPRVASGGVRRVWPTPRSGSSS